MEERQASRQHKIILTNRGTCALNGISDILSFDVNEILLETEMGMLMIRGMDLHVNRLTLEKGEVDLSGKIDSITVFGCKQGKSITGGVASGAAVQVDGKSGDHAAGQSVFACNGVWRGIDLLLRSAADLSQRGSSWNRVDRCGGYVFLADQCLCAVSAHV